jgi:2-iminobutanoate/2-iminopropanoate deaminase
MSKPIKKIVTKAAPVALGPYSQAIMVKENQALVFVSGQLPVDPRTGELIQGDIKAMTCQTLDNIEAILLESSSSLYSVVKAEVFLTNLQDFNAMNEEYAKRFNPDTPPARQTIQVSRLPKDSPLEISCIAVCSIQPLV